MFGIGVACRRFRIAIAIAFRCVCVVSGGGGWSRRSAGVWSVFVFLGSLAAVARSALFWRGFWLRSSWGWGCGGIRYTRGRDSVSGFGVGYFGSVLREFLCRVFVGRRGRCRWGRFGFVGRCRATIGRLGLGFGGLRRRWSRSRCR